jgi:hypothetical protein
MGKHEIRSCATSSEGGVGSMHFLIRYTKWQPPKGPILDYGGEEPEVEVALV